MPGRRPHQKRRSGCAQCKARRMKCDENKPSCNRCKKRDEQCSFSRSNSSLVIISSNRESDLQVEARPANPIPPNLGTPGNIAFQIWARHRERAPPSGASLWMTSTPQEHDKNGTMNFMHHCALYSSLSSFDHPDALPSWQSIVTQLAFKHDFLFHAILSVTSIHIARLHPSPVHLATAMHHYSTAIRLVMPQLMAVNQDNANALCVFSRVLPLYSRGVSIVAPSVDPITRSCEDFKLIRGLAALGIQTCRWIDPLLKNDFLLPQVSDSDVLPEDMEIAISTLSLLNSQTSRSSESYVCIDEAIALLRYSLHLLQKMPNEVIISAPFPMMVSQRFLQALETREPLALAVLSHYAVITHSLRGRLWMEGWGRQVIEEVAKVLPTRWHDSIKWPLDQISQVAHAG